MQNRSKNRCKMVPWGCLGDPRGLLGASRRPSEPVFRRNWKL